MDNDNSNSLYCGNRCGSGRLMFRTEPQGCGCRQDNIWESNGHDLNCRENTGGPSRVHTTNNHGHPRSVGASGDSDPAPVESRPSAPEPSKVLLVHGLDRVPVNCDRVFNLFCLYGNVTTVKILRDDKVLVELEDAEAARRCVSNLHMLQLDDEVHMKVKYSKHNFIHDQVNFNKLADGTPAQKVYLSSTLNRFIPNVLSPDKRRIAAPSKILHFFNAPTDVCGIAVHKAVSDALCRTDAIRSITILPKKPKAKCSTGLIELKSMALAARTVLLSNHMTIESTVSRFPFLTKLCFSKWSEIEEKAGDMATLRFCSVPRTPWLLHKSEHGVPTTEFPISCTTVVNGCGGGDCAWTLWVLNGAQKQWPHQERERKEPEPETEREQVRPLPRVEEEEESSESAVGTDTEIVRNQPHACTSDPMDHREPTVADDDSVVVDLIGMLRNCLCDISNDRGDVLCGAAAMRTEHDNADVAVAAADAASQTGPLGDA
ncbi:uncharacterized protein LOC100571280 [Acyrthosiphon pisum]|uniref:RRM domain-containing protein n=1 Tax=Acyrthosiphon pisum TaxID=7029 RepID=A0A8R1W7P3_ACYPI|nr:uncharacterized protein LOC100571280 [Acyrthosiphon pisum]|eukprot:XP_003247624.1 PREDICTED: uncharacterized protein LOC100571280 [Acyrthosiphon pisum]